MVGIDLSTVPQALADALFNGNLVAGQITLSIIILIMVLFPLMMLLNKKDIAGQVYLVFIVLILAMETAIGWLDAYIFMTIVFIVAVSFSAWFYYGRPTGG